MDEFCAFDIEATVLSDFEEFAFAPPADGVESIARFADSQRGGGDGIEAEAVPEFFFDFDEHVEGGAEVGEIVSGVGHEDGVVEIDDIKTDDEVGAD